MTHAATFHRSALLLVVAVASAATARADAPAAATKLAAGPPQPGQAALMKLRDTLAFDGDPRAIVDARIQIDALLARPDPAPDTAALALRALSGRVDAALASLSAERPQPASVATPLPRLIWWHELADSSVPLALVAALLCLSGIVAITVQMLVGRRLLAAGTTAQSAMQAAGKLFESAARRFMQAQDDAGATTDNALAAATQSGQAAARLSGAARDSEARLRVILDEAEGRLRATLAQAEARLGSALEATEAQLSGTIEDTQGRLHACLDHAEGRLHGADALAHDIQHIAGALPAMVAEAVQSMTGHGLLAIEDASAALRDSTQAVTAQLAAEASALPPLLADAILAVAARGVPAIEAATAQLTARAEDVALAAGAFQTASAGMATTLANQDATLARLESLTANAAADNIGTETLRRELLDEHAIAASAHAGQLAGIAASTLANTERAARCLDDMQEAVRAAAAWPAGIAALADAAGSLQASALELATAGTRAAGSPPPGEVVDLACLVSRIEATLDNARTARADDAAGAALLFEALSARADAALGLLPVQADALAATAAQLRGDFSDTHAMLTAALLTDLPAATQALLSAGATLADQGQGLAAGAEAWRLDSAAAQHVLLEAQAAAIRQAVATSSVASSAVGQAAETLHDAGLSLARRDTAGAAQIDRLAGLLDDQDRRVSGYLAAADAKAAAGPAADDGVAARTAALEGAIARIQNAAARVLDGAGAQEQASARVAEAARQVAACFVAPPAAAAPLMSLARLNGLAAEADILHAQADLLATTALRGNGRDLPPSLPQETPALLAAIEASIQRLRSTATALALASDAARAAA